MRSIHRHIIKLLLKAKQTPDVVTYGASALVYAYVSRTLHSYKMGFVHALNVVLHWLERMEQQGRPITAKELRDFIRTIRPK